MHEPPEADIYFTLLHEGMIIIFAYLPTSWQYTLDRSVELHTALVETMWSRRAAPLSQAIPKMYTLILFGYLPCLMQWGLIIFVVDKHYISYK